MNRPWIWLYKVLNLLSLASEAPHSREARLLALGRAMLMPPHRQNHRCTKKDQWTMAMKEERRGDMWDTPACFHANVCIRRWWAGKLTEPLLRPKAVFDSDTSVGQTLPTPSRPHSSCDLLRLLLTTLGHDRSTVLFFLVDHNKRRLWQFEFSEAKIRSTIWSMANYLSKFFVPWMLNFWTWHFYIPWARAKGAQTIQPHRLHVLLQVYK